jgi:hypothetical protein
MLIALSAAACSSGERGSSTPDAAHGPRSRPVCPTPHSPRLRFKDLDLCGPYVTLEPLASNAWSGVIDLSCFCDPRQGCPRDVKDAIERFAKDCRVMHSYPDAVHHDLDFAIERRDGCGLTSVKRVGSQTQSFTFDSATGRLVGAHAVTWGCGDGRQICLSAAGRAACSSSRVCRLCGSEGQTDAPACSPALLCGIDTANLQAGDVLNYD